MSENAEPVTELAVRTLTDEENADLRSRLSGVRANPYTDFDAFLAEARAEVAALTPAVHEALTEIGAGRGAGALLVRNLPIPADLRPTPDRSFQELDDIVPMGTEAMLAVVAQTLGEAFSYREWDAGALVHNKYPLRAHRDVQFGSNAVEFLLHTETPFRDVSPDHLALLCLRGDPTGRATTLVADLAKTVDALDAPLIAQLSRPAFAFETDNPLVVLADGRGVTEPQPVIGSREGQRVLEFVGDLVAVDAESAAALAELTARIKAAAVPVPLASGDLLVLDNRRMVHGRNAIDPRYDGTDRWLQRMLVTSRLVRTSPTAAERLVSDRRYANYPTEYRQVLSGTPR
ncbi:TauD/TfdA family dioxygenase [Streptomyces sp. NPDC090106]|uniref:TauD/TfdA family dioxygenase n=1 Tax=Streptomyces sp. NPDC090106 TaxID=3365946 RepID=UPI00380D4C36